jgi:hypothetical protein
MDTDKRISSRNTYFVKRVLPLIMFGALALFIVMAFEGARRQPNFPYPVLIAPLFMAGVFYFIFRRLIFDLADEVVDEGNALRVRFGSEEERIPLDQIINVSYAGMTNPPRVTLTLRNPGRFGSEVSFSPVQRLVESLSGKNPLVSDLIARVDAARRR